MTTLLDSNYDDGKRQHLPLVVTYDPHVSMTTVASTSLAGAAITRRFESVNGVAAKPTKKDLGRFWDTLTGRGSTAGTVAALSAQNGAIRKIWLDNHYELLLQRSVPQIGAPLAWQSGYDGNRDHRGHHRYGYGCFTPGSGRQDGPLNGIHITYG